MPGAFDIEFNDARAFGAAMGQAQGIVRDELRMSTDRLTLTGVSLAMGTVHVVTGNLRRSLASSPATFGGGTVSGSFGTAVPYARQENNRGGDHAFMSKTVRDLEPRVAPEYRAALERAISKVGT